MPESSLSGIVKKTISIRFIILAWVITGSAFLGGCGTFRNNQGWVSDVTLTPGLPRLLDAAREAALDPNTWVPAVGAGVFAIDDWDEKVSKWATEHHPVFGSRATADDASHVLRDGLTVCTFASFAFTPPSGDTTEENVLSKFTEAALEIGTLEFTDYTTDWLKIATGRTRPDGSNDRSFPSGHASRAFAAASLLSLNLGVTEMNDTFRTVLQYTGRGAAWGTAWARVEAGKHYPSDVLAGAALANFITVFIHRAFLSSSQEDGISLYFGPREDGIQAMISGKF